MLSFVAPKRYRCRETDPVSTCLCKDGAPIDDQTLDAAFRFLDEQLEAKHLVLVYCAAGRCRSVSIIAGYLALRGSESPKSVLWRIRKLRPAVCPSVPTFESVARYVNEMKWKCREADNGLETIPGFPPSLSQEMATQAHLLASLLPYFKDQKTENVVTLALFQVLQKYQHLQRDLVDWIFNKVSQEPPENIRMTTQEQMTCNDGPDASGQWVQPDICFLDDNVAGTVLMIENKFLAELTSNQPVKYIRLLSTKRWAGLVLIAPQSQVHYYRKLCLERIIAQFPHARADEHCVFIGQKFFFLLSWEELIRRLHDQVPRYADPRNPSNVVQCDIAQLEGIRIKMEGNKIDPFSPEEFAALHQIAGRLPHLYRLLEKVTEELRNHFKVGRVRWSDATLEKSHTQHGLNLRIHGKQFWLLPDFKLLAEASRNAKEEFPLFWLRVGFDKEWGTNMIQPQQREQVARRWWQRAKV